MKICFNLFPPANKLIAVLVCMLLLFTYSKLKADNKTNNTVNNPVSNNISKEEDRYFFYTGENQFNHSNTKKQKPIIAKN